MASIALDPSGVTTAVTAIRTTAPRETPSSHPGLRLRFLGAPPASLAPALVRCPDKSTPAYGRDLQLASLPECGLARAYTLHLVRQVGLAAEPHRNGFPYVIGGL